MTKKLLLFVFATLVLITGYSQNPIFYLLVGTYTGGKSDGIYVYRFNPNKGEATFMSKVQTSNPSYIAISKNQKYVYAVNENKGEGAGEVSAFSFDKKKGELQFLNKQSSGGEGPCFISIDTTGKNIAVANYGGNLSIIKANDDGSLSAIMQLIGHEGYGTHVTRQEMPHVPGVLFSHDQKYLFAADLGNDRLYQYNFNPAGNAENTLTDYSTPFYTLPDGSGPRHLEISPDGKNVYLLNELSGTITIFENNNGTLTEIQSIVSTNAGDKNDRGSADICIAPNGKFFYSSNCGKANDITVYRVASDGKLTELEHKTVGNNPRSIMVDPTGRFLLVANKESNNIQIFTINKNYGLLEDTGTTIAVDNPACLKMMPIK